MDEKKKKKKEKKGKRNEKILVWEHIGESFY